MMLEPGSLRPHHHVRDGDVTGMLRDVPVPLAGVFTLGVGPIERTSVDLLPNASVEHIELHQRG